MYYQSPVGLLKININEGFITEIVFCDESLLENFPVTDEIISLENNIVLNEFKIQLDEYFAGKRTVFDLKIQQAGTPFQQQVWDELIKIPFGKTISYLQLSQRINNAKAVRAVGAANGKNNLPIIVPCHRVIGSNGTLTGYAGGLWRKQWLLEHENKYAHGAQLLF
jgi:methylated-DNA-[protein]-cysteine S-methyltransferase